MKDILSGSYLLSEIDKEMVAQLLELLVPEKLRYESFFPTKVTYVIFAQHFIHSYECTLLLF
jgi:hypothetical protein